MTNKIETPKKLWEFIRGDLPISVFEVLLYNDTFIEEFLGKSFYLEAISNDFKNKDATYQLKEKLAIFLRNNYPTCKCIELRNLDLLGMGSEASIAFLNNLTWVKEREAPYWWLNLAQCKKCKQYWLIARETRMHDNDCLLRLDDPTANNIIKNNIWPSNFEKYEDLIILGKKAGMICRHIDPINGSAMDLIMADVAKDRPGVKLSYLADLLNIDMATALAIAEKAIKNESADINLKE